MKKKFISTDAKVYYAEQLILSGVKRLELTNLGSPKNLPQFRDAEELLRRVRESKVLARAGVNWDEIEITAVTIRESAVDRAIELQEARRRSGPYPDDGIDRRTPSLCQLRCDIARILARGGALHPEQNHII